MRGLQVGSLEEKISLYADDTLLYLQDAGESLKAALVIFDTFGRFSGIRINWSKSIIFPLDPQVRDPSIEVPLLWVDQFKYLGIQVRRELISFIDLNLLPVLSQLWTRCASWASLPLNLMGRINLLKMLYLPKFLYIFRKQPYLDTQLLFCGSGQMCGLLHLGGRDPQTG